MMKLFIDWMERGLLPDFVVRWGIRRLCAQRLGDLEASVGTQWKEARQAYAKALAMGPLAQATKEANAQHYEVPTDFFLSVLGKARKYSCTHWDEKHTDLDSSEQSALAITVARADIRNGMSVLELGCGWGSLSLYMAEKFPLSKITAISNSNTQRKFIEAEAQAMHLSNLTVLTMDLSGEACVANIPAASFDRVVSVEMFEHFKNYRILLARVRGWLKPAGKLFVHIFTHQKHSYSFDTEGEDNWMGKYFFTGGQMPSRDLLPEFQEQLRLENQWDWDGTHYQKTSEAWLKNMDTHRDKLQALFKETYGADEAARWIQRWRVFFISCAELFGYNQGKEWGVSHYLFCARP